MPDRSCLCDGRVEECGNPQNTPRRQSHVCVKRPILCHFTLRPPVRQQYCWALLFARNPGARRKLARMKPQLSEHLELTAAQYRELKKIAYAPHGYAEGKGAEWRVRARLRAIGLLELRSIPEVRLGKPVTQLDKNMWFITEAGRAALSRGFLASNRGQRRHDSAPSGRGRPPY
jgi:hypothetical protein